MPDNIPPKLFEQIFQSHTSMTMLVDPQKKIILDANLAASSFYGYTRDEMRGMPLAQISLSTPSRMDQALKQAMEGSLSKVVMTHVLANGEKRNIQIHPSALEVDGRRVIMSTLHDISRQLEAERELSRRQKFFESVIEHSLDMLLVVNVQGLIVFASPSVENVLGHRASDIQNKPVRDYLHPDDITSLSSEHEDLLLETNLMMECRHRIRHASGAWLRVSTRVRNLLLDPVIQGFVINSRDVSEEQRLHDELRMHTHKLESSNQELKEFAYVASHDLQEPLRKIRSFGGRLEKGFAEDLGERGVDYLRRMNSAADRMSVLIQDLLEYSRLSTERRPLRPLELESVIEGVLEDLELVIRERSVHFDISELPVIQGDETMLRQLFQNLISNAIKFTSEETIPHIQISSEFTRRGEIEVLEITVEDNGIGFDQKHAAHIFQPFQRLHGKQTFQGTGIGLAICRKIVERHQGTIHAFSCPGDGATFIISIPMLDARGAVSRTGQYDTLS